MVQVNWDENNKYVELGMGGIAPTPGPQAGGEIVSIGATTSPHTKNFRSVNFRSGTDGWSLGSDGNTQFNGNKLTSTHFTKVLSLKGVSLYVSDGTTPNGNLSGTAGDICLNGPSGQPFYCGGGTTWTGM